MSKSGLAASKTRFWTLWGTFWKPFGCSGAHFGCLWNALGCRLGIPWASKTFFEAFETHLGAIWELYGVDLGSICAFSAPHSDKGTPALPRFAPRSVTIRGGSQPHERVKCKGFRFRRSFCCNQLFGHGLLLLQLNSNSR